MRWISSCLLAAAVGVAAPTLAHADPPTEVTPVDATSPTTTATETPSEAPAATQVTTTATSPAVTPPSATTSTAPATTTSATTGSTPAATAPATTAAPRAAPTTAAAPRARRRRPIDRFNNTISIGGTAGLGSPLGLVGAFVEYRPWGFVAASIGGGAGGSFGPAVGGTLYIDPIRTRGWALGVGGSFSHNFSIITGEVVPGRPRLPGGTNWLSAEVETQFRPSRHVFVRVGFGRSFLLDTQAFRIATEAELASVNLPSFPFATPIDAVRAAARDEIYGVWFFHIDVAPVWRL